MRYAILCAAAALAGSVPASATTLFPQDFVCPVGGEKFTADVIGSMTSWGQRPDGRRYGTSPIIPLTECPGNGFVYFKDEFSKAEAEQLTPLVLAPDYQALRTSESPFFRGWWLMSRTAQDPFDTSWMLLAASWDSDSDPARKARYQRAFIDSVRSLTWSEGKRSSWFWLNLRAANALRELGEFEASTQLLTSLDQANRLPLDADELKGARFLLDGLRLLNSEKNATPEPASLIPDMEAARRCLKSGPSLTASEVRACQSDTVEKAKKTVQQYLQESDAD
jgi:hypothetical protein